MLVRLLYENATRDSDGIALVHGNQRIDHATLLERVERLAAGLRAIGIRAGDAVGLVLPNDPDFVASYYAVAGLGAVVVPLDPAFKQAELDFCLRSCDARGVIAHDRSTGVCERIVSAWDRPAQVITTDAAGGRALTLEGLGSTDPVPLDPRDPGELLVSAFSSGSTGRTKRVTRTHGQCVAEADFYPNLGIGPSDKILGAIPLFHAYGMGCCLFAAARCRAQLLLLDKPHPFLLRRRHAMELIERERVTVFPGVPHHFRLMAEAPGTADLGSLELCFSAGVSLPCRVFDAFLARFGLPVRQLYGCTEAGMVAVNLEPEPVKAVDSVGMPVGPVRLRLLDEAGEAVSAGEVGEVWIESPALADGYVECDRTSSGKFSDGWFATGDLARVDRDGRLTLAERKMPLIEVAGHKVDAAEVEDVMCAHPKVHEAVVVGVAGGLAGEELVKAVVVPGDHLDEGELRTFCSERMTSYKVPALIEFREEIPKSPLGKTLRKYLV